MTSRGGFVAVSSRYMRPYSPRVWRYMPQCGGAADGGRRLRSHRPNRELTRSSAIAEGPRDASCQLKSCQLPRNSAVRQVLNNRSYEVGGLRWADVKYTCALNRDACESVSLSYKCHKQTDDGELSISPVDRRLAVAS